jgi:dTDP-4-amino-4,6-dideoxygalactose transaminase
MGRHLMPIGGEFWYDNTIIKKGMNNFENQKTTYLDGGQSAIEFIIQKINFNKDDCVLLPSYLCPTILLKFRKYSINIRFYEINYDLSINLDSIKNNLKEHKIKALFFIDYFGFYHDNESILFLKEIKTSGVILIEDAVQMLWFKRTNKFIGHYIFNSYRKFLPYDGSIVLSKGIAEYYPFKNNKYHDFVVEARNIKTKYIKEHIGEENIFLDLFTKTKKYYYHKDSIIGIDLATKKILNNINYHKIKNQVLENFKYLYNKIIQIESIKPIFSYDNIENEIPLAFPIVVNNRDFIRLELMKYNIFCPVHWIIKNEDWSQNFPDSLELSKKILSIPIDWRYKKQDIDYFIYSLNEILGKI